MTLDAFIAFAQGPGLLLFVAGWAAKMALGYGGWRYLRAWRLRRARVAVKLPIPVESGQGQ